MFVGLSFRAKTTSPADGQKPRHRGPAPRTSSVLMLMVIIMQDYSGLRLQSPWRADTLYLFSPCNPNPSPTSGLCFPNCLLFNIFLCGGLSSVVVLGGLLCWRGGLYDVSSHLGGTLGCWLIDCTSHSPKLVPMGGGLCQGGPTCPFLHTMPVNAGAAVNNSCRRGSCLW